MKRTHTKPCDAIHFEYNNKIILKQIGDFQIYYKAYCKLGITFKNTGNIEGAV